MATPLTALRVPADYEAARDRLAHRFREPGVLEVTGEQRGDFLQGQLTQEVKTLAPGQTRPAAGLTPKGKLIYAARVVSLPDRILLLIPAASRERVFQHLTKYVVFQRAYIADRSEEFLRLGLYGSAPEELASAEDLPLPGEREFSAELLVPRAGRERVEAQLARLGSVSVGRETAEILRVEAGRPCFGSDMDESHLPDEIGMDDAISTTKGCYVGQEVVARLRTYGRVNKRLVGFRFPQGSIEPGTLLVNPEVPEPGKIEWGRVTSSVVSPVFGPIGLGFAFREVPIGGKLLAAGNAGKSAIVSGLPFA